MPGPTTINPTYRTIEVFMDNEARYKVQQWVSFSVFGLFKSWGEYRDVTLGALNTRTDPIPATFKTMDEAIDFIKLHIKLAFWTHATEKGVGEPTARYFNYRAEEVTPYSRY